MIPNIITILVAVAICLIFIAFAEFERRENVRLKKLNTVLLEHSKACATLLDWMKANPQEFPQHPEAQELLERRLHALRKFAALCHTGKEIPPEFRMETVDIEELLEPFKRRRAAMA